MITTLTLPKNAVTYYISHIKLIVGFKVAAILSMKNKICVAKNLLNCKKRKKKYLYQFKRLKYTNSQKILLCSLHRQTMKKNIVFQLFCSIVLKQVKKTKNVFCKVQPLLSKNHNTGMSEGEKIWGASSNWWA